MAESVIGGWVAGGEFGQLCPTAPTAPKDIGRPTFIGAIVIAYRPNHSRVPTNGHRIAEPISGHPVAGGQLGLLAPTLPAIDKDVGRAVVIILAIRPDHGRIPADRDRVPEPFIGGGVAGREFG